MDDPETDGLTYVGNEMNIQKMERGEPVSIVQFKTLGVTSFVDIAWDQFVTSFERYQHSNWKNWNGAPNTKMLNCYCSCTSAHSKRAFNHNIHISKQFETALNSNIHIVGAFQKEL